MKKGPSANKQFDKEQYEGNVHDEIAPENFSIIENPNETVSYFGNIIKKLQKVRNGDVIYFDIENIMNLTMDSVMYLLAIIKNIKRNKFKRYDFAGNFPKDGEIFKLLRDSGFLKYVNSKEKYKIERKSEQVEITSSGVIDQKIASQICDFVNSKFKTKTNYTRFLYNMLIELMANTFQHAYEEKSSLINHWYIFAKYEEGKVKFIFLDTGSGIPQTIAKKFFENIIKTDNECILSALRGEFRTKTKLVNRGKGLPRINSYYKDKMIDNLIIISGRGYCFLDNNIYELQNSLNGTLFYWEININSVKKEYFI